MQFLLLVLYMAAIAAGQQCSSGTLQCCNAVESATNPAVQLLAGVLGIVLSPSAGDIGLTCTFQQNDKSIPNKKTNKKKHTEYNTGTPISVVGTGGNICDAQAACCTGESIVRTQLTVFGKSCLIITSCRVVAFSFRVALLLTCNTIIYRRNDLDVMLHGKGVL